MFKVGNKVDGQCSLAVTSKTSENVWFSGVFRGCKKSIGLKRVHLPSLFTKYG